MSVSIIVSMSDNNVVGNEPPRDMWRQKHELQRFREVTINKTVIMGRKTYEKIGHPLAERKNIVITSQPDYQADGCVVEHSLDSALANHANDEELIIMGGGQLFREALAIADKLYVTEIHAQIDGNITFTFSNEDWVETEREDFTRDPDNVYDYSFVTYTRK